MHLTETIFIDDKPIGVVRQDSNTREIAFSPIEGQSRLPEREWASIDELKAAVIREYKNENEQATAP
jgi:hypothetical protein